MINSPPVTAARWHGRDRGALSIFTVIITLVVVVFLGAIVDFEQKLQDRHDANSAAEEAARAGAGQVDRDRAYAHGGIFTIDPQDAVRAAESYLRAGGYTGTVTVTGDRQIQVSVTITKPTIFLQLIGISTLHVRATAVADLVTGVTGEDR